MNPNNNLDQRNSNQSIQFNGNLNEVAVGSCVKLQSGDVSILVQVQNVSGANFTGVVESFENWNQPEWNGWTPGTEVTFNEQNIFCCQMASKAA